MSTQPCGIELAFLKHTLDSIACRHAALACVKSRYGTYCLVQYCKRRYRTLSLIV